MAVLRIILPLVGDLQPNETPGIMEQRLSEIAGIYEVDFNTIGGLIKVVFEENCLKVDDLRNMLQTHGYHTGHPLTA